MVDDFVEQERVRVVKPKKDLFFREWLMPFVGFALAVLVMVVFVRTYVVPSSSMENTLQVGDYMLSVPLLDNMNPPGRGDVVVFRPPASWDAGEDEVFVKRVIAVGGDSVECCEENGSLTVNGVPVDEPYLKNGEVGAITFSYTVPMGEVFVLGDNRPVSADSRYHPENPFVPLENVIGQPFMVFWPLQDFKLL